MGRQKLTDEPVFLGIVEDLTVKVKTEPKEEKDLPAPVQQPAGNGVAKDSEVKSEVKVKTEVKAGVKAKTEPAT